MSNDKAILGFATRSKMIQSSRIWSPLNMVANAIAAASETEPVVYVERRSDEYRWSLATKGGGYPLLRISARFLGVDYKRIYVGFRTLPDGTAILCEDPSNIDIPDKWAVLNLQGEITPPTAARRIRTAVGRGDARPE